MWTHFGQPVACLQIEGGVPIWETTYMHGAWTMQRYVEFHFNIEIPCVVAVLFPGQRVFGMIVLLWFGSCIYNIHSDNLMIHCNKGSYIKWSP